MFEVLLLHDNSTLHTSFHIAEAITKFWQTLLPIQLTVLTLHHQIIPCLVILKSLWGRQNAMSQWRQRKEGNFDQAEICTLVPWW